jgi:hypothetical protein
MKVGEINVARPLLHSSKLGKAEGLLDILAQDTDVEVDSGINGINLGWVRYGEVDVNTAVAVWMYGYFLRRSRGSRRRRVGGGLE